MCTSVQNRLIMRTKEIMLDGKFAPEKLWILTDIVTMIMKQ
jgi:hypothetical protein